MPQLRKSESVAFGSFFLMISTSCLQSLWLRTFSTGQTTMNLTTTNRTDLLLQNPDIFICYVQASPARGRFYAKDLALLSWGHATELGAAANCRSAQSFSSGIVFTAGGAGIVSRNA